MEENTAPIDVDNLFFWPNFHISELFCIVLDVLSPALPNIKNQCHSVILVLICGARFFYTKDELKIYVL